MLQAYVDDSIASNGKRPLILAAYVLTADRWIEFSDSWDVALHEEPAIDYFKMAEANGRGGCFRKFSEAERTKKVFRMAGVVKDFAPHGLHASVNITEFNEILKPSAPYPMDTPYFPLCYAIIYGLARLHEKLGLDMKCDVIFDDHSGLDARVTPLFEFLSVGPESWRNLIGGKPSFRDDKEVVALQAADLLAWHLRRRESGVPAPDYEGILDLLLVNDGHYVTPIDAGILVDWAKGLAEIPNLHTVMNKRDWAQALDVVKDILREGRKQGMTFGDFANLTDELH